MALKGSASMTDLQSVGYQEAIGQTKRKRRHLMLGNGIGALSRITYV
jgi:hypothetical protein